MDRWAVLLVPLLRDVPDFRVVVEIAGRPVEALLAV